MFYKEEDISNELICPKCLIKYRDPRVLPCGESLCNDCILDLVKRDKPEIDCVICHETHQLPTIGNREFPKNVFIMKLLAKKSHEIGRGKLSEELKLKLKEINDKSEKLEQACKGSTQLIADYCFELRTQIDLATETLHDKLNKYREEFLKKLKNYELDCLAGTRDEKFKDELDEFLKVIDQFNEAMTDHLKSVNLDESFIKKGITKADGYSKTLDVKLTSIDKRIFMNRKPKFKGIYK